MNEVEQDIISMKLMFTTFLYMSKYVTTIKNYIQNLIAVSMKGLKNSSSTDTKHKKLLLV